MKTLLAKTSQVPLSTIPSSTLLYIYLLWIDIKLTTDHQYLHAFNSSNLIYELKTCKWWEFRCGWDDAVITLSVNIAATTTVNNNFCWLLANMVFVFMRKRPSEKLPTVVVVRNAPTIVLVSMKYFLTGLRFHVFDKNT